MLFPKNGSESRWKSCTARATRRQFRVSRPRYGGLSTEISEGDLIVIPKVADTRVLAIGTVQGECTFTLSEEESRRHQRPVDWQRQDVPIEEFGSLDRYINAPGTVQPLDDNLRRATERVIETGSAKLTWWVNQGHNYWAEQHHGCVSAPQRTRNGRLRRMWADVGRLLAGDRVIHYSEGEITAISTVMT